MLQRARWLVTAALIGLAPVAGHAGTWTAYTFSPSETLQNVPGLRSIAKRFAEASGGDVDMQLQLGGQLPIKATDITQAVGDNIIQFGDDAYNAGNIPLLGILKLPLLLRGPDDLHAAWEIIKPTIEKQYEKLGVVPLAMYNWPAQMVFATGEFTKVEDFAGRKVETDSPQQTAFVEAFGGTGFAVNAADVASALQRGTLDVTLTASSGGGRIWEELLSYNYRLPVTEFPSFLIVNKDAFDALSPELQQKLRSITEEEAKNMTAALLADESKMTDKLRADGMKIIEPTKEDLDAAMKKMVPYWEQWAQDTGPEAVATLKKIRAQVGR